MLRRETIPYDSASFRAGSEPPINKSLVSNLIAAGLVAVGFHLPEPWRLYVFNAGLFAVSGGITNWLAVHMLFERVPLLYGSGVVPTRFEEFKHGIRQLIMDQFFDDADLEVLFHKAVTPQQLGDAFTQVVDEVDLETAFESLLDTISASSFGGMLTMLGGRKALEPLKSPVITRLKDHFRDQFADPQFRERLRQALQSVLDDGAIRATIAELIDQRLEQMTPELVKEIIQAMIRRHLGWLVVWGCAFGGLIGLAVTWLTNL